MKKIFLLSCILTVFLASASFTYAFIERTDKVFSDKENVIYMIGWIYNRLTGIKVIINDDAFRIYRIDLKNKERTVFYNDGEDKPMDRLTISPDNNYIAVLRREKEKYDHTEIFFIDKNRGIGAQRINEPDGIITYVWSPDSKNVVYMTGTLGEGGVVKARGIFLYNLGTREKRKIAETALDIEWLPRGDLVLYNAYIEQRGESSTRVYKTTVYTHEGAMRKEQKGVNLSLDGNYSIEPRYIGRSQEDTDDILIDFIDLDQGRNIAGSGLDNIFMKRTRILWRPILWLKGNRLIIEREVPNSLDWDISICDIATNRELKIVRGRIVGVNSDRSKLVIHEFYSEVQHLG